MSLADMPEEEEAARVALMGLSGTGKSTLAASLSKTHRLWWFTLDNDSAVLRKLPIECQKNIEFFNIPDSAAFPVAADTMMKLFKAGRADICRKHGVYYCSLCKRDNAPVASIDFSTMDNTRDIVVIDTGSQLSHSILSHATKGKPVDYKPERDDWGALRKWTEFFYSQFQAAHYNLIVIFHAVEATLEDDKVKLVPSFGSKDMSSKLAGAFSHVIYTDIRNKKHVAFSDSTAFSNVLTKSRTDFKIEDLPEPSLAPLFMKSAKPGVLAAADIAVKAAPPINITTAAGTSNPFVGLKEKYGLTGVKP